MTNSSSPDAPAADAPVRLSPGDSAPAFTLTDSEGASVSLADFAGSKVIIYFYPAAMTPGCTTQACDFRDSLGSLQGAGYTVLGISKDSPSKLREFAERDALTFPLLSDENLAVHQAYGAYGEKNSYGRMITGVLRSTFVIDENGTIELALYNVKATGHVASLRKKLKIA
ncbi:peroxiredoxin Q/BCP [Okibacterium sp. HSC-33S16]|uniref:thioredoxin-dependent thiol peroxidase n=1 Tax=Okibacterium sp. HSC-33S16 TaxID=2910965 RepID=UPI00209E7DDE|nr:thioredoxin-dependent thiol peroxidase [Okibacterium sp. HSC-33S16]MCP2031731.1 peroxiredoxin Q/BCP [Okibacterium sp. HSC-33S16]